MRKSRKATTPPLERCDECQEMKSIFGFASVGAENEPPRSLCPTCSSREYMRLVGMPALEVSEFEPITRFDSIGRKHVFHFAVLMTTGLGISASEWFDDGPGGYQFMVLEHPESPVREAYEKLVRRIEAGLAEHYVESTDFPGIGASQNRLHLKGSAVNGRIDETASGEPAVVVDGRPYSWREFGRILSSYTGFDFRLECFDQCEQRETACDPEKPNPIWWLDLPEHDEEDRGHH